MEKSRVHIRSEKSQREAGKEGRRERGRERDGDMREKDGDMRVRGRDMETLRERERWRYGGGEADTEREEKWKMETSSNEIPRKSQCRE